MRANAWWLTTTLAAPSPQLTSPQSKERRGREKEGGRERETKKGLEMLRKIMLAALVVGAAPGAGAFQAPISLSLAPSRLTLSSQSSSASASAGAGAAAPLGLRLALPAKQFSSRRRATAAASVIVACAEGEPESAAQAKLEKFVKTPGGISKALIPLLNPVFPSVTPSQPRNLSRMPRCNIDQCLTQRTWDVGGALAVPTDASQLSLGALVYSSVS